MCWLLLAGPLAGQQGPRTAVQWLHLGNQRAAQAKYTSALPAYQMAVTLDPASADALYGVGWCYRYLGRYEEAESALRRALRVDPHHRSAGLTLGEVLLLRGSWPAAEKMFYPRQKSDPDDYLATAGLTRALVYQGRYAQAKPYAERAVRLRPDLPRPRVLLGRIYLRQQKYAPAEEALLAGYNLDSNFEPAARELMGLYLVTERPGHAQALLRPLLRRHPREVGLLQAQLRIRRARGLKELISDSLEQLIAALPAGEAVPYRRELAQRYLADRKYSPAEKQLRAALATRPNETESIGLLTQVLLAQGKVQEASGFLTRMTQRQPERAELFVYLAQAQLGSGQFAEALASAQQALRLRPDSEPALRAAQTAAQELGRLDLAVTCARRRLACRPQDGPARLSLMQLLTDAGRLGEAMQQGEIMRNRGKTTRALQRLSVLATAAHNPDYELQVERQLAAQQPESSLPLVELLIDQRRYQEAEYRLAQNLRRRPYDPDLLVMQSKLLRPTNRHPEAGTVLDNALSRHPRHGGLNLEMGLWLAEQANAATAMPYLRRGLIAHPESEAGHDALVKCAHDSGEYQRAIDLLLALAAQPSASLTPQATGLALEHLACLFELRSGAQASAQEMCSLSDTFPARAELALPAARQCERADLHTTAGRYYERAARQPEQAERALRLAVMTYSLAGDSTSSLKAAAMYLGQVAHDPEALALVIEIQALSQQPQSETLATLVKLVGASPGSYSYQHYRLDLFAQRARLVILETTYALRATGGCSPADSLALAELQSRRGEAEKALQSLRDLPAEVLADPPVALLHAELLHQRGDLDKALEVLDEVRATWNPQVALQRAELLKEKGRYEEALAELAHGLQHGTELTGVLDKMEQLWREKKVSLASLLTALSQGYAVAAQPRPLRAFVQDKLRAGDPAVQQWIEAHPSARTGAAGP